MSANNTTSSTLSNAAGVVSGHAQLAKGAVEQLIGDQTGSQAWSESGAQAKDDGANTIRQSADALPSADESKASELANKACPSTGDGLGSA